MLTEGWDAKNVTHIMGLRAFTSQLLCEQVVGRGLRRMDYTVDPKTGFLTEEYVDVYGIPFSVIPFKGRETRTPAPEDKPKNHVYSVEERKLFEIRFPVVEGYAFALRRNLIRADIDRMELLRLEPATTPTAVFVKPQVGYQFGRPSTGGGFEFLEHDREGYYASTHLQTIKFEIARQVVWSLTSGIENGSAKGRLRSRHQLFPQVFRLVNEYVGRKVDFHGCTPVAGIHLCRKGSERMLCDQADDEQKPPFSNPQPLQVHRFNRRSISDYKMLRHHEPHQPGIADTNTWSNAAFRLEQAGSCTPGTTIWSRGTL
jgi:type III restriction enzyme